MMNTLDIISQWAILILCCSGMAMIAQKEKRMRKWGWVLGLCSQPFWFYTTIRHQQWALALTTLWFTYAWGQGVWNFVIRKGSQE